MGSAANELMALDHLRRCMQVFDALPPLLRQAFANAPVAPDTVQFGRAYLETARNFGRQPAQDHMLRQLAVYQRSQVGPNWTPFNQPPRRRPRTPPSLKLAPAVPEVCRGP